MNNYHLLVFILFIYSVNGEYKMIGTGKGVLSAHQTGSSSFVVKEIPFSYSDANIWWNLERDANYVNGVFIHPKNHPDLVWDSKGYKVNSGTPIILYTKKATLGDTRNQRFNRTSLGQYAIILGTNMVVNVSGNGELTLTNKAVSNLQYTVFTPLGAAEVVNVIITNYDYSTIFVSASGPLGNIDLGQLEPEGTKTYTLWAGCFINVKSMDGEFLSPTPYKLRPNSNPTLNVPGNAPLPVGMNTWRGTVTNLVTHAEYPSHINITFSGDPSDYAYFSGVGKDHYGMFTVSGSLNGGYVTLSKYPTVQHYVKKGTLNEDATVLSGFWQVDETYTGNYGGLTYQLVDN